MFAPCYSRHHCHHHCRRPRCLIVVLFIIAPFSSFTSPSARSLCFRGTKERRGRCHCDQHLIITSYRLLLLVAVPLLLHPPISLPPPPLPLLVLFIGALHPLPLLSFLIVVLHLIIVVVTLSLSLHHHLVVNVLSFVMGSDGPSSIASTYSHPDLAAPPLVVDCCVSS